MLTIGQATDMDVVRQLLEEYRSGLGIDLSFQDFHGEVDGLPGDYDPILLAYDGKSVAGCVAVRRLDERTCELKRLYVRPQFRGRCIGRALVEAAITEARRRRYERMRLDTLPSMNTAMDLYESLGFRDIPAYRFNPFPGARFMELVLPSP